MFNVCFFLSCFLFTFCTYLDKITLHAKRLWHPLSVILQACISHMFLNHQYHCELFQSIQKHMGEEKLQTFINFALSYMSQLKLPVKRGTFIEFRTGLINVCPVGRSCSQAEREQFFEFDKEHRIRENFVKSLEEKFPDLGLVYSIGVLPNSKHV